MLWVIFGRNVPNLDKPFTWKFRKSTIFKTKSCCDSVTCLSSPISYRMENIFRAHKEEIIPQSSATIYQLSSLANHQNFKLLKRFDVYQH